jgi:hypothetical protein
MNGVSAFLEPGNYIFSIKSALLLKSFKFIPGLCIAKMHTAHKNEQVLKERRQDYIS